MRTICFTPLSYSHCNLVLYASFIGIATGFYVYVGDGLFSLTISLLFKKGEKRCQREENHGGLQKAAPHTPQEKLFGFSHRIKTHPYMGICWAQHLRVTPFGGFSQFPLRDEPYFLCSQGCKSSWGCRGRLFGAPCKFSLWRTFLFFKREMCEENSAFPNREKCGKTAKKKSLITKYLWKC